jgi:hypothetical protein
MAVWWIVGSLLLLCGMGILALVGWATCRAGQLDDPTHPYLPPIERQEQEHEH